ncbi:FAD-binding oxidoreductase [Streptomyces sp. NPDC007901]|uniref:FAD-binding oxidoreductase n=1 Tax=Streptomyces sp. NPDC007901 TaxID=3364785 RepID=UPI0036ECF5C5
MTDMFVPPGSRGRELRRGEVGYEAARCDAVWNARKPGRWPDTIVLAMSERDIIVAVDHARDRGMRVALRAGGHSLWGSALRESGVLIDISRMRDLSIDLRHSTATVGPGVTGLDLIQALAEHRLAFPVGHCPTVALSGYLLAGGLGWNLGTWGPACSSLESVRLVTAQGELVSADAHHNAELFWAVRGAGTGFFGVVTSFTVRLYPEPEAIRSRSKSFPLSDAAAVGVWLEEAAPDLPPSLELRVVVSPSSPSRPGSLEVWAAVFCDSASEADDSLRLLFDRQPAGSEVVGAIHATETLSGLLEASSPLLPEGRRYSGDALWSDATLGTLLESVALAAADAPSEHSVILVCPSPPTLQSHMPDAAFSVTGKTLVLPYAAWEDRTADDQNRQWLSDLTSGLKPFTHGHYVGEADLVGDPSRSVRSFAPAHWQKLQSLRATYDPQGLFYSFP